MYKTTSSYGDWFYGKTKDSIIIQKNYMVPFKYIIYLLFCLLRFVLKLLKTSTNNCYINEVLNYSIKNNSAVQIFGIKLKRKW